MALLEYIEKALSLEWLSEITVKYHFKTSLHSRDDNGPGGLGRAEENQARGPSR